MLRHLRLATVIPLIAIIVACGGGSTPALSPTTTSYCPVGEKGDFQGRFSEECVRSIFRWNFQLPNLTRNYEAPVFAFTADQTNELRIQYESRQKGTPRLELHVFPADRRVILPGQRSLTTPRGHTVWVGPTPQGFGGQWDSHDASYIVVFVEQRDETGGELQLISALADEILDRG